MQITRNIVAECEICPQTMEVKLQICPVCLAQKIIRGKWKLVIIWLLRDGKKRFSELQRSIPNIKQSYLTHQLKELEADGILTRKSYNEVPPKVEYSLTSRGEDFLKVMEWLDKWGQQIIKEYFNKS